MRAIHCSHFIGCLEQTAGRKTEGDARDCESERFQLLGHITSRGITFYIGAERENDLARFVALGAFDQRRDAQLFRSDAVQRRNPAHQCVVHAAKRRGLFQGENVVRPFNDTNQRLIASRAGARVARIGFGVATAA